MRITDAPAYHTGNSYSREAAEPFAIRTLRQIFLSYSAAEQARIRADVQKKLAEERKSGEFRNQKSALARLADKVYGIRNEDLQ